MVGGHQQVEANWIHLENPSLDDMVQISQKHHFPLDYLTSALDPDEIPREEGLIRKNDRKTALITCLYPRKNSKEVSDWAYVTCPISIVIVGDKVYTCVKKTPDFMENMLLGQSDLGVVFSNPLEMMIELFWRISKEYIRLLRGINQRTNDIHAQLRTSTKSELLLELSELQKTVIYFETAIDENSPLVDAVAQSNFFKIDRTCEAHLYDVQVENYQAEKMIHQTSELLEKLSEIFTGIVSQNLNIVMKILTSLTIIITIPTIVAGIWGMNVKLPFENHPWAFVILGVLTLGVCALTAWWLKQRDLL